MEKASKAKAPKAIRIINPANPLEEGMAFFLEGNYICLRRYFVNEYGTCVSEEVAAFSLRGVIDLIWRGENPYAWLRSQANFFDASCELSMDTYLYQRIEEDAKVYARFIEADT